MVVIKVNIFCHRGLYDNKEVIENTIQAFKKALDKGLAIELDIRMTKDKKLVVYHDDNLKRLSTSDYSIDDITYNELKEIRLLNNSKVPLLLEVLNLVDGKTPLLIEIKKTKNISTLIKKLDSLLLDYNGEVMLQSFDPYILKRIKASSLNRYKKGILITNKYKGIKGTIYCLYIYKYFIKSNYCDFISIHKALFRDIEKLVDKDIYIWTIKNRIEYNTYQKLCPNLICEKDALYPDT